MNGAEAVKPKPEADRGDPVDVAADDTVSVEVVAVDMRAAQQALAGEQVDLARLFAQNAVALNLLAGADPGELRAKAILKFLDQCAQAEGFVRRTCPVCNGTGKGVMIAQSLSGASLEVKSAGSACERCGSTGVIRGAETMDERKFRRGRAEAKYRTLQQSSGRVLIGLVWVPAEAAEGLGLPETSALKRAIPLPCQRCAGLGREDCAACRGRGKVTCRAKGCERGLVERESLAGAIGGARSLGRAGLTVKCETCGGSGLEPCEKCTGAGSFVCKACNGGGCGETCGKCSGTGIATCRRCAGTRVYRGEPCSACRGAGAMECASCGGSGRKR